MLVLVRLTIHLRPLRKASVRAASGQKVPHPVPRLMDRMVQEADRRYKAKEIQSVIAHDPGVSRQHSAECLPDRGAKIRWEGPSAEQVREMCRRSGQDESLLTVGVQLGFHSGTVRKYLLLTEVTLRIPYECEH